MRASPLGRTFDRARSAYRARNGLDREEERGAVGAHVKHGLEILLTTDQNLRFQQSAQTSGVAVIVMAAVSNRLADLVPLVPAALKALTTLKASEIVEIRA